MTIHVTFDDLEPGTRVTTQYERKKGVVFTTPCVVIDEPETLNHSLQSRHLSQIKDISNFVIRGTFTAPKHTRVTVTASCLHAGSDGVEAVLRVYNVAGEKLTECIFGSPGPRASAELICPDSNIAGFELSGATDRFDCLDCLAFDSLPQPDFRVVCETMSRPLLLFAEPNQSVTARLNFSRLNGSSGEIMLSIADPCPGTAWRFNPPSVHPGVHHVDVEIVANSTTQTGPRFDVQIVAIPRTRAAGVHERVVVVPVTVLPPVDCDMTESWVEHSMGFKQVDEPCIV
jgi:hypothetical protein